MSKKEPLSFYPGVIYGPLLFVLTIWVVYWAEIRFGWRFTTYGIYPQRIEGLRGVLFGPFIHGGLQHLFNNSVPLFVLTASLFYFYRKMKWSVLLGGLLLTGLLTWFIGRPSYHIGASGIVYLLASFLFFRGVFSKKYQLIALSLVVVFLYGSLLWYVFPIDTKISWEGHLSGFLVGLVFAFFFKEDKIPEKKYDWQRDDYNPEEDKFLQHFDEEGNFIEITEEPNIDPKTETEIEAEIEKKLTKINYYFRKNSEDDSIT
ncbi:rhomboid family intramembrane serine protease [uncultured Marixanthomonas sp.]|uniref:rhomboid family intramembrane serine protease n=1 Tax=uncultured Marixanthomonas sp. TaxID=757245 RepID=UPI0030DDAE63|tara:strand:- start:57522 stop:58301 length:780 start_codon:yes stop_codon:yes gene_type:complete